MAGVTFWNFYFQLHPGSIRAAQVVEFLDALRRQIRKPLLVVWDQLATHRSRLVRQYIEASRGRIAVEFLPAYAPELNPVEYLWGYWKQHELANVCPREYWRLGAMARMALKRMKRKRKRLVPSFWKQAECMFRLTLYYAGLNKRGTPSQVLKGLQVSEVVLPRPHEAVREAPREF